MRIVTKIITVANSELMRYELQRSGGDRRGRNPGVDKLTEEFLPCGRCSFFLAGYRVLHGVDHVSAMAEKVKDGWLELRWDEEVRELVQQSYGGELDIELFHYDSRCPECLRRYTYHAGENAGERVFRIEIING
jgi:hypothetical protein